MEQSERPVNAREQRRLVERFGEWKSGSEDLERVLSSAELLQAVCEGDAEANRRRSITAPLGFRETRGQLLLRFRVAPAPEVAHAPGASEVRVTRRVSADVGDRGGPQRAGCLEVTEMLLGARELRDDLGT
jgi:hypothetical protein